VDKLTRTYGSDVTRNNYIQRLTADLMSKAPLSQRDVMTIVNRVGNLASTKETTVKGLWFEKDQIEKIFVDVMGEKNYIAYADKNDPLRDIVNAAAGDYGIVGLAPGFSGRVKAWKPIMGVITDRAYPVARFGKLNPIFYNLLEPIETKMSKFVFDIRSEVANETLQDRESAVLQRMFSDQRSANRELSEGLFRDQEANIKATITAVNESPGLKNNIARKIQEIGLIKDLKFAMLNPLEYKSTARDFTASTLAVREFDQRMVEYAPEAWAQLKAWGLGDARTVVNRMLEDFMIQSNPEAMARALKDGLPDSVGLWTQALTQSGLEATKAREVAAAAYGIFQDSMIRATKTADRYQYFSQERTWFERSINHPFLGIYHYSYMTQKAIPMMLTLMFKPRLAGRIRPGLGIVNYLRLKEYLANDLATNNDFWSGLAKDRTL
jgi:hypothetical protein